MLTPDELYIQYSNSPCTEDYESLGSVGAGTPYDLYKLSIFLKQLKYPCIDRVPNITGILNTGSGQLSLPFKFLEILDPECFTEIQPTIEAGTAHAIRNAADISRACSLFIPSVFDMLEDIMQQNSLKESSIAKWDNRGATEHMVFFGKNNMTDCLFVLGPDMVTSGVSNGRGTGCGDLDCLPGYKSSSPGSPSALGAGFSCADSEESTDIGCTPCRKCQRDENGDPLPDDLCCTAGSCEEKVNYCCGDPPGSREYFRYSNGTLNFSYTQFYPNNNHFPNDPLNKDRTFKHAGYLTRRSYGGYANLFNNSDKLNSCPEDLFLKYIQSLNGYDYKKDTIRNTNSTIQRLRTISLIKNIDNIKDLLFNGYGVVLLSNVGFSNKRDSKGLSYPDRIWYHSYAIIGCDDTKKEFNEAVYLLANSWGDWNSGGHPSWGPLPVGSFLVTESHLKCMLNLERIDKAGCKTKRNRFTGEDEPGCITNDSCSPWECNKYQKAMGYAFALSFSDGFSRQDLDFKRFYWSINHNPTEFIFKNPIIKDQNQ